eukprot:maker-scaffold999_size72078-snap-gene-0.12 protein:Tk06779 transcript:maker-scaffold999_size72078-snap-gene-0.12-mRNA-1 annotation:"zinc finger protein 91-like"
MGNYGKHATHVDIHELNFGYKHTMALEVVEDMPWEEVKNMALVVRKSPTGLFGLKPLLNQDCLDKFLAQDRACPKIEAKRLTHTQFCRSMLEIFKWLVNVKSKDMVERFPTFGQEFRKIRGLWNMVRNANISQSLEPNSPKPFLASDKVQIKQCEYCEAWNMGVQGAVLGLEASLKMLNTVLNGSHKADWILVALKELKELKTNLVQALQCLEEKPRVQPEVSLRVDQIPDIWAQNGDVEEAMPHLVNPPMTKRMKLTRDELPQGTKCLRVSPQLKDLLLWLNAQPLCHRKSDPPLALDFDLLRGHNYIFYGLHSALTWKHHLTFLLMKLPHFRHNHYIFFASIFKQSVCMWRLKMIAFNCLLRGEHLSPSQARMCPKDPDFISKVQDRITADRVQFGLRPNELEYLKHLQYLGQREPTNSQDSGVNLPLEMESEEGPPDLEAGFYRVEMVKAFGTMQFYAYNRSILPAMKTDICIGLVGLLKTDEGSLKGRMIVRHHQSSLSNPEEELANLTRLLSQVFGMPRKAIFKWQAMLPKDEGTAYREYSKNKLKEALHFEDSVQTLEVALEAMVEFEEHSNHVDIQELNYDFKQVLELRVVDDLPWRDIKNMALVMKKSHSDNLALKPLLIQDCMDKFLSQARACAKIEEKKLTHSQFCRSMLEIFKFLTNVKADEMVNRFPAFGQEFRKIRALWNTIQNVGTSNNKQCEHCGKIFAGEHSNGSWHNLTVHWHMKKCKMEKTNCGCDLVFSSPRDKRNHMLLKHSSGNYIKCEQCQFLTKDRRALDNHVEHYHGFPGREEICNLCQKSFRCRNHLNQHHFTHESHYCTPCGQEYLGRLPFRKHMKTKIGFGERVLGHEVVHGGFKLLQGADGNPDVLAPAAVVMSRSAILNLRRF